MVYKCIKNLVTTHNIPKSITQNYKYACAVWPTTFQMKEYRKCSRNNGRAHTSIKLRITEYITQSVKAYKLYHHWLFAPFDKSFSLQSETFVSMYPSLDDRLLLWLLPSESRNSENKETKDMEFSYTLVPYTHVLLFTID